MVLTVNFPDPHKSGSVGHQELNNAHRNPNLGIHSIENGVKVSEWGAAVAGGE